MDQPYRPAGYCPRCGYPLDAAPCPECGAKFAKPAARWRSRWQKLRRAGLWLAASVVLVAAVTCGVAYVYYEWWPIEHVVALARGDGWLADASERVCRHRFDEFAERARERNARISHEAMLLTDHPWAGRYWGGRSVELALAPSNGFAYSNGGCFGWTEIQYGGVEQIDGSELRLAGSVPLILQSSPTFSKRWLVIPWDGRVCIVPVEEMRQFCIESNSGLTHIALVRGDEPPYPLAVFDGVPDVPIEFRAYLLPAPLEAEVVEVCATWQRVSEMCGNGTSYADLVLNIGRQDGVFAGLRFYAAGRPWGPEGEVTEVDERTCRALFDGVPIQGSIVSTRNPVVDEVERPVDDSVAD